MSKDSERKNAWAKEHTERIVLEAPKGMKSVIRSAAEASQESMTTYILNAVRSRMASE